MKPIAGLNRDVNPIDQPENTMRYAANGVISESTGLAENIRDELLWVDFGEYDFIGHCLGENDIYVWLWNIDLGHGEIWRYNPEFSLSEELVLIDLDNILNLDEENASNRILQIVYEEDFRSHEVFVWAGVTKPKILDVGEIIENYGLGIDLSTVEVSYKDFLLYPEGELHHPSIISVNDTGGNVSSGAWFFCYRYVYNDLSSTGFSGMSSPAYVYEDSSNDNETLIGDDGNRVSSKSITVGFHIDPNQSNVSFIQFGYISVRDGVIYAGILNKSPYTSLISEEFIYTGNTPEIDLGDNIAELITPKAIYDHVGTITTLTSRLYVGALTSKEEVDVQNVANAATTKWYQSNSNQTNNSDYKNKTKHANSPSFGPGDVYALYLHVNYLDGTMSRGFHIPGAKWVAGYEVPVPGFTEYETWQVYDTVTSNSASDGNTGYWANKNEIYPDIPEFDSAKDILGPYIDNVRHHRLPTFGWMYENGFLSDPFSTPLFNIDIDISSVPFSAEILSKISGWSISFAKRKFGDMVNISTETPTVFGSSISSNTLISIASNHAHGTRDVSPPDPNFECIPDDKLLRFHALHLLDDRPSINPKFFVKEAILNDDILRRLSTSPFIMQSDLYTDIAGLADQRESKAYKYGQINGMESGFSNWAPVAEADRYFPVGDSAYIKNGVKYTFSDDVSSEAIDNNAGEDCYVIYSNSGYGIAPPTIPLFGENNSIPSRMLYGSLRQVPENPFSLFNSQILINPISVNKSETILRHNKGDSWGGWYQFNTTGVIGGYEDPLSLADPKEYALLDTTTDEAGMFRGEGSKVIYSCNAQSPINFLLQQADPGDLQSFVAPILGAPGSQSFAAGDTEAVLYNADNLAKAKAWYVYDMNIYESMTFIYNEDFHRYSEYFIYGINDGYYIQSNLLPTTIAFSLVQPSDSPQRQWRNWLLNNRYVQPSEKGKIINLKGAGNQMLYIHHRYSLYTTKDRISMQTDSTSVVVGSSDIFSVTPYEIVSVNEGHTGIVNRNYFNLSPFGYSWIQTDHGKVYIHDGKSIEEVSGTGMRIFFRDSLFNITFPEDNPDEAYYIINDDLRRRLIIGFGYIKNTGGAGRAITFSIANRAWSFFQDMTVMWPIIARDKRVFSWGKGDLQKVSEVYAVAEGNYNNLTREFIIEMVVQDGTSNHKYLQFLTWNTNVLLNNVDIEEETFTKCIIYSDTKLYGGPNPGLGDVLEFGYNLIPYTGFPKLDENVRRLEDNWVFNSFRDLWDNITAIPRGVVDNYGVNVDALDNTKTWYNKSRMRDKYLIVRLHYKKDNSYKIEVENIQFGIKPSFR